MHFLTLDLVRGSASGLSVISVAFPYPTAPKFCLRLPGQKKRKELLQRHSGCESMPGDRLTLGLQVPYPRRLTTTLLLLMLLYLLRQLIGLAVLAVLAVLAILPVLSVLRVLPMLSVLPALIVLSILPALPVPTVLSALLALPALPVLAVLAISRRSYLS